MARRNHDETLRDEFTPSGLEETLAQRATRLKQVLCAPPQPFMAKAEH
jgi:hypothetical protein